MEIAIGFPENWRLKTLEQTLENTQATLLFRFLIYSLLLIKLISIPQAQDLLYYGQLSSWMSYSAKPMESGQLGIRYIPFVSYAASVPAGQTIEVEASVKIFSTGIFQSASHPDYDRDVSPYRLSLRLSGTQYELRVGLQKINFGSASVFRPLMWFDTIDSRDPLQITSGVYGILGRYYFLNNANVWLWCLIGNEDPKGWEYISTTDGEPEFGGRIQIPLPTGEAALSYHHRKLELGEFMPFVMDMDTNAPENRLALDGKWDMGIGFWLETVFTHHESDLLPYLWEQTCNIGADYTFAYANGINVLTEYFIHESTDDILQAGEGIRFSTLSVNYPLGVLDRIGGILYYDWDNNEVYRLLNLQRNYDNWSFYLFAFWNPSGSELVFSSQESSGFAGKGVQLMVVYNH